MDELDLLLSQSRVMSDVLAHVRRLVQRVGAGGQLPSVLILGETGTGKTRLAEALHRIGPRKHGPFVDCRLESMPESLAESELFGHEKGAFTGAVGAKRGLFQTASGGTLLLDEIGVASPALQVKLLKAVGDRVVRRVGSTRTEPFDAWILSATNEDLDVAIRERRFREDLYHRLSVLTLRLPPLRERGEDVLLLAHHFLNRTASDYGLGPLALTRAAEAKILAHTWPGNVRELANTVERAALLAESSVIDADALDIRPTAGPGDVPASPPEVRPAESSTLHDAVRERLQDALDRHGGNISRAARALGIARNTLRAHIRRLDLRTVPTGTAPRSRPRDVEPVARPAPTRTPSEEPTAGGPAVEAALPAWQRQLVAFLTVVLEPPPDVTATHLTATLGGLIDKLEPFGGRIREMRPHGLTVLFGVEPLDDLPRRAANAALAAQKAIERAAVGPLAAVVGRVALHVGECLVAHARGAVGIEPAHEGAARAELDALLAVAPPGAAVVSRSARSLLERRFELVALEGDAGFRLTRHERSGLDVGGRRRSRFVGRAPELAALEALLVEAERGRGQIVGILGEPGYGKTRLIREFLDALAPRRVTTYEGGCLSYASASPYQPIIEMLRHGFALREEDGAQAVADTVRSAVVALALDADELAPFLLHLLGAPRPERVAGWSPEAIRRQTVEAIRRLVLAGSRQRPLVVVIEDLQWIDRTSEETLAALADIVAGSPLMLLTTYRPGYQPPWAARSNATQFALRPLEHDDSLALVRSVAADDDLTGELSERVLTRAAGVPLFIEELTRALTERPRLADDVIPETVQATLTARLGHLSPPDRALLQTASVIGRDVPATVLAAVAGVIEAPLRESLGRLEQAEFLFETRLASAASYRFKHVLTQEAAYRSLPDDQRRVVHARVAEAMQRVTPEAAERQPELLAHHCTLAGLTAEAIGHWHRGGQRAIQRSANVEAITHLTSGLRLLEADPPGPARDGRELALLLTLTVALVARHGYAAEEVERALARVRSLTESLGDTPELVPVRFGLWRFYASRAELSTAEAFAGQILAAGERARDAQVLVAGHAAAGITAFYRGQLAAAERHLHDVQRLHDPARGAVETAIYSQDLGPSALGFLGWTQTLRGQVDRGAAAADLAVERARAGGHPFTLALTLMTAGLVRSERREAAATERHGEELLALSEGQGFGLFSAFGLSLAGYGRFLAGDAAGGLARMRDGIDRYLAARQRVGLRFRTLFAEVLVETGRTGEGLGVVDALLAHAAETGEGGSISEVYRVKALALRERSPAPDVVALLEQAIDLASAQDAHLLALRAALSLVQFRGGVAALARLRDIAARFDEGVALDALTTAHGLLRAASA